MALSPKSESASMARGMVAPGRYSLGNIGVLVLVAVAAVVAGLALNWNWLVAVGIAPILLSVLPCVVMCAFGICVMHRPNKAPARSGNVDDQGTSPGTVGRAATCCHDTGDAVGPKNKAAEQPETQRVATPAHL